MIYEALLIACTAVAGDVPATGQLIATDLEVGQSATVYTVGVEIPTEIIAIDGQVVTFRHIGGEFTACIAEVVE